MTFKNFILEGGSAITGISRIPDSNILPTAKEIGKRFLDRLGFKWHVVGSAGKKESSGDIDIIVDIKDQQSPTEIANLIAAQVRKYLPEVTQVKRSNIVSFDYPIVGLNGEKCQIDLMPQGDFELGKFVLSKNKYVSILINKIAKIVLPTSTKELADKKVEIRFTYDAVSGLALGVKEYRRKIQNGFPEYGPGKYTSKTPLRDPKTIILVLFGPNATESDVDSVESIINLIKSGKAKYANINPNIFPNIGNSFTSYTSDQTLEILDFIQTELYNS